MEKNIKDLTNEVSFETALGKLELIVKQLEKGELPLAESLKQFADGIALSQLCLSQLNTAEKQIDTILKEVDGQLVEKAWNTLEGDEC